MNDKYLVLQNADGKKWMLHEKNLNVALCLYQPSSLKGRLLKKMLPILVKVPFIPNSVYKKFGITRGTNRISQDGQAFFSELYTDAQDIQIAVFYGTPGTHQKITAQISMGDTILGYCKFTENQEIYRIFQHEQKVLKYLEDCGITNIPKCIRCDLVEAGKYIFAQTTIKTRKSEVRHELGMPELDFLRGLAEHTQTTSAFEHTDFYQSVQKLYRNMNALEEKGYHTQNVRKACDNVVAYYQHQTEFSAYHRDFTPWNTFVENGTLFVFDFEYAAYQYPACLDAIHYLIQTAIFEKRMMPKDIYALYRKECESGVLKGVFECPEIALQAYLVDIISLYASRGRDCLQDAGTVKLLNIWSELCAVLCEDSARNQKPME